jgi:hypothetical protein
MIAINRKNRPGLAATGYRSHLSGMTFELTDEETTALLRELDNLIDGDRYQFSARVRTLKAIRAKIRPEPAREPLPPPLWPPMSISRMPDPGGHGWSPSPDNILGSRSDTPRFNTERGR